MNSSDIYSAAEPMDDNSPDFSTQSKTPSSKTDLTPTIRVIGVGGAGGNAINNMVASNINGIDFIAANTDSQALGNSSASTTIQLGEHITQGLGAGSDPSVGEAAAEEASDELKAALEGTNLLFVAAGMGGGTGTGATSVIARVAKELGILTIGVVTKPFAFEGARRMRIANEGIQDLRSEVDTLIVIPNQNLFRLANEKTTFADAFVMADKVLNSGITCVTDLILKEGLINLDFADIKAVVEGMGNAMMGVGIAQGEGRAIKAAEEAISNPLIDDVTLKGAKGLLINISGGLDMTLYEVDEAANRVRGEVDDEAVVIIGATFDSELNDEMKVAIVASGLQTVEGSEIVETPEAFKKTIVASFADPDQDDSDQDFVEPEVKTYDGPANVPPAHLGNEAHQAKSLVPQEKELASKEIGSNDLASSDLPPRMLAPKDQPSAQVAGNQGVAVKQGMPQFMADSVSERDHTVQTPAIDPSIMGERVRVGGLKVTNNNAAPSSGPLDHLSQQDFPPHAQKQPKTSTQEPHNEIIKDEGFFEKLSKLRLSKEVQAQKNIDTSAKTSRSNGILTDQEILKGTSQTDRQPVRDDQLDSSHLLPDFLKRKK